ncbi:MAG TPA: AIR carboxylase family protein [Chloroflexota bacterium]|nr:AIR carboxylase family protein [Chloroflexota bacterium]
MAEVVIILGSPSDQSWAQRIVEGLRRFDIPAEIRVASAHKTPAYLLDLLREAEGRPGERVFITVAGRSNALSGFVDAAVAAPVIACPPASEAFGGMDILSSLRMPSGVAPLAVLDPGNAALAAAKMLALSDPALRDRIRGVQQEDRGRVIGADRELNREKEMQEMSS